MDKGVEEQRVHRIKSSEGWQDWMRETPWVTIKIFCPGKAEPIVKLIQATFAVFLVTYFNEG